MSPKTVLIYFTDPTIAEQLLRAALSVTAIKSAAIGGIFVIPSAIVIPAGMPVHPDQIILDKRRRSMQQAAAAFRPVFDAAVKAAGSCGELRLVHTGGTSIADTLIDAARLADLVVVGQAASGWSQPDAVDAPDNIALSCGRPVLVIPAVSPEHAIGRRVLIAWNGSREAARATFDALPLLLAADLVKVVWICPEDEPYIGHGMTIANLCATLARHGIRCEPESTRFPRRMVGSALAAAATAFNADLIVMGCYGHSRLLEFVLGGVTRHMLKDMKCPVLMSN